MPSKEELEKKERIARTYLVVIGPQTSAAWASGDYITVEDALSDIINTQWYDPHAFANRSLVRARRLHWDAALEDARASINIQPTVIGYIALSVVLCGQGNWEHALQAVDLGFIYGNGDVSAIYFLLLVKSIIIFKNGRCDEGMARITDLITSRSENSASLCRSVQAYMYTQLGMTAMKEQQYDRVVQLSTHALRLGPDAPKKSTLMLIFDFIFDRNKRELKNILLIFGWRFDTLWRDIHQQKCEALYSGGRMNEVVESLHAMMAQVDEDGTKVVQETDNWLIDFKHRCAERSQTLGDEALRAKNYNEAVDMYSVALGFDPSKEDLLIKRSEASAAMGKWKDAFGDAKRAIKLNSSSPLGYQRKHAALHGAQDYRNAIEAFRTMLSKLESSPDPATCKLRQQYVSPSEVARAVQSAIDELLQNVPLRLIETTTGRLCDRDERINAFKRTPAFGQLVSSVTTRATFDHEHIAEVVKKYFRYTMLSHKWEGKEPLLCDVQSKSVYDLESLYPLTKLQKFCHTARDAGYIWAWSDTCCIDKTNSVELQQSLNSMFHWYHDSSLTVVYLSDVPRSRSSKPGALAKSAWSTRGWTLQEFLAPNTIRFFANDWTPYMNDHSPNHKFSTNIMQELEDATGISAQALVDFCPGTKDARQKLQWASTRITTVQEDAAYSLLGIFDVSLFVNYGERKQKALGRLLEAIVSQSGDVTALDWIGQSSEYNSCLPADITVYETPACVLSRETETSSSGLQSSITAELAMTVYNMLNNQPPPRFANRRLTLPCIVFPLTALGPKGTDSPVGSSVYYASADGLDVVEITTADRLSRFSPSRPALMGREMLLVRPWSRDLLATSSLSNAPAGFSSEPPEPEIREPHQPLMLVVRLCRRFAALLLERQRGGEYKRVASEQDIIAQVQDANVLTDIRCIEIL